MTDEPAFDRSNATNVTDLRCKGCGHEFTGTSLTGVSLEAWTDHLEMQKCPRCGRNYEQTSSWDLSRWKPEWKPAGT